MNDDQLPTRFQGAHEGNSGALRMPVQKSVESSRAVAEVQAAVLSAKQFPRDTVGAYNAVIEACKRKRVAENSTYEYERGGSPVRGPSIRLAEVLAQNYGNLSFGIVELERGDGESQMMAYCHDLQSNTRQTRVFAVPHTRTSKARGKVALTDDRDVYETTANQGARRLRACILGIIPSDFVDGAMDQCVETLKSADAGVPLADRIRNMLQAFSDFSVNQEMIEKKLGHKLEATSETELVRLRSVYTSIKDGFGTREQFFTVGDVAEKPKEGLEDRLPDFPSPKVDDSKLPLHSMVEGIVKSAEAPKVDAPSVSIKAAKEPKKSTKEEKTATIVNNSMYTISFGGHSGKKLADLTAPEISTLIAQLKSQQQILDAPNPKLNELLDAATKYYEQIKA